MTFTDGPEQLIGSSTMQVAPWLDVQWRIDHEAEVVEGDANTTNGTLLQQQFHVEQAAPAKKETTGTIAETSGSRMSAPTEDSAAAAGTTAEVASDQEQPKLEAKEPPLVNVDFDMGLCLCE